MHTLIEFEVPVSGMMNTVTKDTFKKLGCMVDNIPVPVSRIEGKVSNGEVAITIMTDDKHVTIAGKFDGNSDKFLLHVWLDNVPAGILNWHPMHGQGKLDLLNFENDFTEIINS
jgi:hypothetical protein